MVYAAVVDAYGNGYRDLDQLMPLNPNGAIKDSQKQVLCFILFFKLLSQLLKEPLFEKRLYYCLQRESGTTSYGSRKPTGESSD